MKVIDQAYIGLDLHANSSVFHVIDLKGHQHKRERILTSPPAMNSWLQTLPATHKHLVVEEGPLTQWISWKLVDSIDELVVCDPKQNHWISRAARKGDGIDAGKLAPVWHPDGKSQRALFAAAATHYLAMRRHQVRLKQQIKALFRRWGGIARGRESALRLAGSPAASLVPNCNRWALATRKSPNLVKSRAWAHLFDAMIQTPHRFASPAKLWSWSGLAVTDRSSSGKPLGYERLDPSGRSEIKDISYRAWKAGRCRPPSPMKSRTFTRRPWGEPRTPPTHG